MQIISNSKSPHRYQKSAYDHLSRRAVKHVDARDAVAEAWLPHETHTFVYDGWNPILKIIVNHVAETTTIVRYLWGLDLSETLQGAGGVGGLLAYTRNGALRIPVYDHIGNVVAIVDDTGTIVAAYEYDSFGNTVSQSGAEADEVPFRFSTKYFDPETGLYYYGYRFYAPELGRWINRDPIEEEGGENLYALVENNPVLFVDPLGLQLPYLGDFGDPVSLPYYENTPPYGPYYPYSKDGLSYWEGGMKYFFGDGSDEYIPIDQLGLTSNVKNYFDPCTRRKGDWEGDIDVFRIGNWSRAGPGRVSVTIEGILTFSGKCWTYYGFLKAEPNDFDFNPRPWGERDPGKWIPKKEIMTRTIGFLGAIASAKEYKMHFLGELLIFGKGRCP